MAYIPISQLSELTSSITSGDFFPLVTSSSLTTYKVTLKTLGLFFGLPQISCSWVSQSISSSYALSASYPPYPQISMSWADISLSSSYTISASWAPQSSQVPQDSCSLAKSASISSSYAISASFSPQPSQSFVVSMSWASQSISTSYAITASWAPGIIANSQPIMYITKSVVIIPFQLIPAVLDSNTLSTISSTYTIPPSIPYRTGVILQTITGGQAGSAGDVYVSSSVIPSLVNIGYIAHSTASSVFFANVGPNAKLYIKMQSFPPWSYRASNTTDTYWGVNIIGYY